MFETLDANVLAELAKIEDRATMNKDTHLTQVMACLDSAAKECAAANARGVKTPTGESYQQIEAGLLAAQRIVSKYWGRGADDVASKSSH